MTPAEILEIDEPVFEHMLEVREEIAAAERQEHYASKLRKH